MAVRSESPQTQAREPGADTHGKDPRQSQLFLDDTWIDETARLERVWEAAERMCCKLRKTPKMFRWSPCVFNRLQAGLGV
jgi:hypothetical protein